MLMTIDFDSVPFGPDHHVACEADVGLEYDCGDPAELTVVLGPVTLEHAADETLSRPARPAEIAAVREAVLDYLEHPARRHDLIRRIERDNLAAR